MLRKLRLKRKAHGLGVMVLIPLIPLIDSILLTRSSLDWFKILRALIYPLILWMTCFVLVKLAQDRKAKLIFFEDFNVWKGVAIFFLWPSFIFLRQLLTDYHYALDFHPFHSVLFSHLMALFLAIFIIPSLFFLKRKKRKKWEETRQFNLNRIISQSIKNAGPNLIWIRFFFLNVGCDLLGKIISYVVGGSYLLFFYMSLLSFALPLHVATEGSVLKAQDFNYRIIGKYTDIKVTYCLLFVKANNKVFKFALDNCPLCARQPNANVIVTHSPFDFNNRRVSSVICENE